MRELAEVLGESRSGVNRVLLALTDLGLAQRTGAGNYRAGPRLKVLADRLLTRHPLLASAPPILGELSARTQATAIVAVHDWPLPRCFVAVYHGGEGPVRYNLDPGTVLPLHAGAAGQAILSELGISALGEALTAFTPDTVVDTAHLEEVSPRPASVDMPSVWASTSLWLPVSPLRSAPMVCWAPFRSPDPATTPTSTTY